MIARHYIIHAQEGQETAVKNGLIELADLVRPTAGCHGVDLLYDLDHGRRFIFVEKWESAEAHQSAMNPKASALLAQLFPLFEGKPDAAHCEPLKTS